MSVVLSVVDLHKSYGPTVAVCGVSLDVAGGEIFGLLGPNGAGKTTTLECILGLRLADAGQIHVNGIDAVAYPEKVKTLVGAQLQATALQDKITPREALKFFGSFYRDAITPDQLLERFSLNDKADSPFDSMSAGQKQRLALSLAFVNDPPLVFLDEPTAGLDAQSRSELHSDILRLKAEGRSVVLSTHYIEEAERLCDRIAIINAGVIAAIGTPAELIRLAGLPDKVVVKTSPVLAEEKLKLLEGVIESRSSDAGSSILTTDINRLVIRLVRLIETEGVELIDLQIRRASLEDAYLKMVSDSGSRK